MPGSGRSAARALVTALVLLLAALLGVECACAQPGAVSVRTSATAPGYTAVPYEHPGTAEDDCKPRHGPRRAGGVAAPVGVPGRAYGRDVRAGATRLSHAVAAGVREAAPRGTSVALPLLHQTFRC
ncbi:hypothetical protein HCC61_22565 [Streptomyces sp. HNM0575]|uniref:hypothetical protein n=1 Tax=Streptomyces sp. HNM0575 TaxID=2716338 RepID=UPI00145D4F0E|nr:hypothetical protein [Streptomyces sp. HNM0575]NLU75415.1 hypothetical protein [Streptomyces sp. HNM0575]